MSQSFGFLNHQCCMGITGRGINARGYPYSKLSYDRPSQYELPSRVQSSFI